MPTVPLFLPKKPSSQTRYSKAPEFLLALNPSKERFCFAEEVLILVAG
jgi:hypothetical protein